MRASIWTRARKPPATRPRSRANAVGVLIAVIILAGAAAFFGLSSANVEPVPVDTPAPRPTVHLGSASPTTLIESTPQLSHVAVTIQMPLPIFVPDRDSNPDDGTTMYWSAAWVVSLWTWLRHPRHRLGRSAFPAGLGKSVFDSGLWVSSWPNDYTACGPDCWAVRLALPPGGLTLAMTDPNVSWLLINATTYRIDPATGAVTLKLESTYLVGASFEGACTWLRRARS